MSKFMHAWEISLFISSAHPKRFPCTRAVHYLDSAVTYNGVHSSWRNLSSSILLMPLVIRTHSTSLGVMHGGPDDGIDDTSGGLLCNILCVLGDRSVFIFSNPYREMIEPCIVMGEILQLP